MRASIACMLHITRHASRLRHARANGVSMRASRHRSMANDRATKAAVATALRAARDASPITMRSALLPSGGSRDADAARVRLGAFEETEALHARAELLECAALDARD